MNKLALALATLALVAPLAFTGPVAASHGPPYPFVVVIEKPTPSSLPQPAILPAGCVFTLLNPWTGHVVCVPPFPEGRFTCAYVVAHAQHHPGSLGAIVTNAQCTNGPPTVAVAIAPNSATNANVPGDWDFPFTCTVSFDPPAAGFGLCAENDP